MHIGRTIRLLCVAVLGLVSVPCFAKTVVFWQAGFPASDSPAPDEAGLRAGFAGAEFADAAQLREALGRKDTDLLVLPYGSAWPEADWDAILEYLDRGGNLIVLGGKPFTRAAYEERGRWHLRMASVAQSLELFIHDYQETPGYKSMPPEKSLSGEIRTKFEPNLNVFPLLPRFGWKRAFSPVVRLSVVDDDTTGGHTGYEDMDLTTLAWGERAGHRLSAPVIELDHNANRFVGGRWILVACDPDADFFSNAKLLATLDEIALRKNDRFTFRPRLPLFVAGEAMEFRFRPSDPMAEQPEGDALRVQVTDEDGKVLYDETAAFPGAHRLTLPASAEGGRGFHTVEATLLRDGKRVRTYRSGYWMRDWDYLLSGPKLTVGSDYFELDGKPLPVVGTTYMSSDVSRMYLLLPNAYVWNQDMAQIRDAGLNMIRTGLWTTWKQLLAPNGQMSEDGLRTVEAFLMCARHAGLPVQFNLFAFYPDEFGGGNGYLDPAALQAESRYAESVVARFSDVPFLAWDLINEPSANKNLWRTLPHYDPFEQAAWRKWIAERYPDQSKLLHDWAEPSLGIGRDLQAAPTATTPEVAGQDPMALPKAGAFQPDAVRSGFNPLQVYDYTLFTQDVFAGWVKKMRGLIRGAGSQQLITVGQDEGGVAGRVSPAFYSPLIDFTADHTWWDYDAILWASLAPKFPGKPLLIQETGEQRRLTLDDHLRFSPEVEADQLERKVAIAFAQGAGALEWVWNVNPYMANDNEIPIGAVRPDGTEKPEARVLAGFAAFAAKSPQSFTKIVPPAVTMVTSQVELYSTLGGLALETRKKALRAMAYFDHQPLRMLPENRLDELCPDGVCPKLVFLPSPQGLTEKAWQGLLAYAEKGGTLLVTGPVNRDEHWTEVDRMGPLGIKAETMPLAVRGSELTLDGKTLALGFPADVQQSSAETMRFADGKTVEVVPHGSGRILWAADPVEFAEGYDATAGLYRWALDEAGVKPVLKEVAPLSHAVLAFPTVLDDAELYSFSNESMNAETVDIVDALTGAHIRFTMEGQRGAALLLDRQGKVLASYGGAAVAGSR
jgi:Cellulase (glycosyl hydrolase family 5)